MEAELRKRILIIASLSDSLLNFRRDLIQTLVIEGNEVLCCAAEKDHLDGSYTHAEIELSKIGAKWQSYPLSRTSTNPIEDFKTLLSLRKIVKGFKPDIVLSYTVKPNIYGSIASRGYRSAKIFSLITGITAGLRDQREIRSPRGKALRWLYRIGLQNNEGVIFQNPDDLDWLKSLGIITTQKTHLVNGSGVDLEQFPPVPLPSNSPLSFLCIARLLAEKGIREFADAARNVKQTYPSVEFNLVGPIDPQPSSVQLAEIKAWEAEGVLHYHGQQADVRPWLAKCSVFVLPSYREGTPRTVLEALATGRAIITSNAPGCRQTVVDGLNGYLVPVRSVSDLVGALSQFCQNPELVKKMGDESLKLSKNFDVHSVTKSMIDFMIN